MKNEQWCRKVIYPRALELLKEGAATASAIITHLKMLGVLVPYDDANVVLCRLLYTHKYTHTSQGWRRATAAEIAERVVIRRCLTCNGLHDPVLSCPVKSETRLAIQELQRTGLSLNSAAKVLGISRQLARQSVRKDLKMNQEIINAKST